MKSSRRDFLRGRAVADAVKDLAGKTQGALADESEALREAGLSLPGPGGAGYLTRVGRRAMACEFEVLLNAGQYPAGTEAALAALDLVDQLEERLSVYRESSEVSRLNRSAQQEPVVVESRLFALLQRAAEIYRETGGAYDIATGPLTKLWGFYRRQGQMPDAMSLDRKMQQTGMRYVELNAEKNSVQFLAEGVEINLGSIGKGYALDRAAELLVAERVDDFLLHGGNSSVLGRGQAEERNSVGVELRGWWIGLKHPLEPARRIGEVCIRDRALGTSGSGTQFFVHEGRTYGHILDPRTGWPAEGTLSTTVAAATGADADALATAFYVLGREGAIDYCRRHPGISAVIMSPGEADGRTEVTLWGWTEDQIRMYTDDSLLIRPIAQ